MAVFDRTFTGEQGSMFRILGLGRLSDRSLYIVEDIETLHYRAVPCHFKAGVTLKLAQALQTI